MMAGMKHCSAPSSSCTRRRFAFGLALGALGRSASAAPGVRIGLMTYSLRDRPLDAAVAATRQLGFRECEVYSPHIEFGGVALYRKALGLDPAPADERSMLRQQLREWRHTVPLAHFTAIGAQFRRAGIALSAYTLAFRDDFDDLEIERGFQMARALGAPQINASATLSVLPRIVAAAQRHRMRVGVHNHAGMADDNEIETARSIASALAMSKWIGLNLDIGHAYAAGVDPVALLADHHARITTLHLKDRMANDGPNKPFGEGQTPVREVLQAMQRGRYRFAANIEYEYRGAEDATLEIAKALRYCRATLA